MSYHSCELVSDVVTACLCFTDALRHTCPSRRPMVSAARAERHAVVRPDTRQKRASGAPAATSTVPTKAIATIVQVGRRFSHFGAGSPAQASTFLPPPQDRPTFAAVSCLKPIQRRNICRPMSREELSTGKSSYRALPKTAKFLHAH